MDTLHPVRFTKEQIRTLVLMFHEVVCDYYPEECKDILDTIKLAEKDVDNLDSLTIWK